MSDLNFEGLTDAQLRLYAVRCVRRVQRLMTDPRSVAVLDVAERHAKGEATDAEWAAARAAASDAASDAELAADAAAATWYAARAVADAMWVAAWDEAAAAAWDAAWAAERAEQKKILDEIREVKP